MGERVYEGQVPGFPGEEHRAALALHARTKRIVFAAAYAGSSAAGQRISNVAFQLDGTIRFAGSTGNTYELSFSKNRALIKRKESKAG